MPRLALALATIAKPDSAAVDHSIASAPPAGFFLLSPPGKLFAKDELMKDHQPREEMNEVIGRYNKEVAEIWKAIESLAKRTQRVESAICQISAKTITFSEK